MDWVSTNWEGVPDIIPVEGSIASPEGRIPEEIENDRLSPLIEGVMENGLSFVRTYSDSGYENEEIGVRTVNEREKDRLSTSFDTLIVTDWDMTDWEGDPDIIPVELLRERPIGRDPDEIENESSSPLTVGETENDSSFLRA